MRGTPGIYKTEYGFRAVVNIAAGRKQKRFPPDTPIKDIKRWRNEMRVKLETLHPQKRAGAIGRGTFTADVRGYLKTLTITSWKSRRSELKAWEKVFGHVRRSRVTDEHVKKAIKGWADAGVPPKTIQNRVRGLTAMYHSLDGPSAWTPADGVPLPKVRKRNPDYVAPDVLKAVAVTLETQEATGLDPKWRARYMVMAATGQRPVFVKRAEPGDLDLHRGEWRIDAAKDGNPIRLPLNADMRAAWQRFIDTEAWGEYDATEYAAIIRGAGWPETARPYATKHSLSQDLGDAGVDLETIADWHGHTGGFATTRIYTGFVWKKLKAASEAIEGRLGWGVFSPVSVASESEIDRNARIQQLLAELDDLRNFGS